jgi:hypothetical protein
MPSYQSVPSSNVSIGEQRMLKRQGPDSDYVGDGGISGPARVGLDRLYDYAEQHWPGARFSVPSTTKDFNVADAIRHVHGQHRSKNVFVLTMADRTRERLVYYPLSGRELRTIHVSGAAWRGGCHPSWS